MSDLTRLWRRTPPVIFPLCLALMALGLGWRGASAHLPIPQEIGDLMLGCAAAFTVVAHVLYLAKILTRPRVVLEDLKTPPARGGVAAAAMAMMLLAAALLPLGLSVPQVWWTGVVLQIVASALVCHAIWRDPPEARGFTPFQYLSFVGPIVGPLAGIPLGYVTESIVLAMAALVASTVITVGLARQLLRQLPPPLMRPTLVIFLAPNCLFGITFGLLDMGIPFQLFYWLSWATAIAVLAFLPWLTRAGFTPLWGAFTFPLAAFINLQVIALGRGLGLIAEIGLIAGLVLGTPVVLVIGYRLTLLWISGTLSEKSGTATA